MKKTVYGFLFLLTACAHILKNPYENYSRAQLAMVSSPSLCEIAANRRYKMNANVLKELIQRGYRDCSESEIYCIDTVMLKPGTSDYANCRMARDQYNLNVASQRMATFMGMRQLQLQQQAINTPTRVYHYF